MFPRSPDGRCRKPRPLRYSVAVPLTLLMTAVVVATVGRGQGTGPEGVGTPGEIRVARNTGRRLFDGWFGREKAPEADPPLPHPRDFIPAPQPDPPPPASDRASAAASAAATVSEQPGASGDETPATVTDEENTDEDSPEDQAPPAVPVGPLTQRVSIDQIWIRPSRCRSRRASRPCSRDPLFPRRWAGGVRSTSRRRPSTHVCSSRDYHWP